MPIGLKYKATLDDSQFIARLNRMHREVDRGPRGGGVIGRGGRGGGGGFIGGIGARTLGAAALGMGARNVMRDADQMHNLSRKTGIAVQSLAALAEMGKTANIEIDQLAASVVKMDVALSRRTPQAAKALADMGLTFEELDKLKPEEKFAKIGAALAQMGEGKASAANALFGRSGTDFFEMFDDIAKLDMNRVSENAKRIAGSAKTLADAQDAIDKATMGLKARAMQFMAGLISGDANKVVGALAPTAEAPGEEETEPVVIAEKGFRDTLGFGRKESGLTAGRLAPGRGIGTLGSPEGLGGAGSAHSRVSRGDAARAKSRAALIEKEAKASIKQQELLEEIKKATAAMLGILEEELE